MKNYCPRCDKEFEGDWKEHECYVGINEMAAMQAQTKLVSVMDEAKAYVISDSQEMLNFYKQTWNEAIEAAALIGDELDYHSLCGPEIRKLKK